MVSKSPIDSTTTTTTKKPALHSSTLYCFCQKPYDVSQFMIACDRCDQWFHGECIGIDEKQGEFIDLYFCADCAKISSKQTSWKSKCSNPSCLKPARMGKNQQEHLSKYCSDDCGMQVARQRLGNDNDDSTITFSTRMEQLSKTRLSLFADRDDRQRLERIRNEKRRAIEIINKVNLKKQFLQAHIATVEGMVDDSCGFDSRLLWEDDVWNAVTGVETQPCLRLILATCDKADGTTCHQKSKRCQRHNGWSKLKTVELEQEREEQFVVLSILARERKLIKARMENRMNEMNVARSLMNGTLLHFK
ncbi:hypothetical protein BC941DRAFT_387745 [Chlamydoabsidia padenii]|nr:hypothetical protein BC941DRAFT_387745 [Chlamydoabsidia padenii]